MDYPLQAKILHRLQDDCQQALGKRRKYPTGQVCPWCVLLNQSFSYTMHYTVTLHTLSIVQGHILHPNLNSIETSFCSCRSCGKGIGMAFCTWHDDSSVVACAEFCSDIIPDKTCAKTIFPSNLNHDGKIIREMAPGLSTKMPFFQVWH